MAVFCRAILDVCKFLLFSSLVILLETTIIGLHIKAKKEEISENEKRICCLGCNGLRQVAFYVKFVTVG